MEHELRTDMSVVTKIWSSDLTIAEEIAICRDSIYLRFRSLSGIIFSWRFVISLAAVSQCFQFLSKRVAFNRRAANLEKLRGRPHSARAILELDTHRCWERDSVSITLHYSPSLWFLSDDNTLFRCTCACRITAEVNRVIMEQSELRLNYSMTASFARAATRDDSHTIRNESLFKHKTHVNNAFTDADRDRFRDSPEILNCTRTRWKTIAIRKCFQRHVTCAYNASCIKQHDRDMTHGTA
jgi:hypothetical protein